ncbi:MFS transporter [Streptococcus chenjunshii]|uniref:MFS transporter n=1 Tax=Streptococcus chenjunshii TaxID=2173853 RepID=A0A372KRI8_9STRE|nr:MFS transporter [Streptococcus chenjunshii]AXQ78473.1 MFS transporter [Streptococcus chenjunshii]RFU52066.1 MFS transporter [Streptococcus chenjunshii]RFU54258.1 MFS transporter [Streptococcus chenjunshii]
MTKKNRLLVPLLTLGVFSILNTEMGITGIVPHIARYYNVPLTRAGLLVSAFALVVAFAGPTMPLLFSRINRKTVMLLATGAFAFSTLAAVFAPNFTFLLLIRILPAVFHPVYVSLAMTVAATSVPIEESQKAIARVFMGVSAGSLLGVPVSNFLANHLSLQAAMTFFAAINIIVFLATIFLVPSLPAEKGLSYGEQLRLLTRKTIWISIISVLLLNGAVFGFNAYLSDFLDTVSHLHVNLISLLLLGIGAANIVGNGLAGQLLAKIPKRLLISLPLVLIADYILLFLFGGAALPAIILLLIFGVLAGIEGNVNQYLIYNVGGDAPDFANGLFLAAANLGVTLGTSFCGFFIRSGKGTAFALLGSIIMFALGFLAILIRQAWVSKQKEKAGAETE